MSNTRPFTQAHAIASLDIAIVLDETLTSQQRDELASAFASHLANEGFSLDEASDGDADAIGFKRRDSSGDVSEELHIHSGFVHLIWFEYRGWAFVRESTIQRLSPLISAIREGKYRGDGLGAAYKDVFFNSDPATYTAFDVFRKETRYLAPSSFSAGRTWRSSISWLDESGEDEFLGTYASLSVDARTTSPKAVSDDEADSDGLHVTEITHRQSLYGVDDEPPTEWSEDRVRLKLDRLRSQNKALMLELISDDMVDRIGLKE